MLGFVYTGSNVVVETYVNASFWSFWSMVALSMSPRRMRASSACESGT